MSAWTHEDAGAPTKRGAHHVGHKVRRNSKPHEWSASFWRKAAQAAMTPMLNGLKFYASRLEKRKGAAYGEITAKVQDVWRVLVKLLVSNPNGVLEPSYERIRHDAGCCRATVARALEILERHGFLERMRRCVPHRSGEAGKWEQDTNAYRLSLPPAAKRLLEAPHATFDRKAVPAPRPGRPRRLPALSKGLELANKILPAWEAILATLANDSSEYGDHPEP
ncbi:MAG: hypothetical protein ACYDD1_05160 [Caulobacteraceae bacterium]